MEYQIRDPHIVNYISLIFDSFTELHGDRRSGDDRLVTGGLARLNGHKVAVVCYQSDLSVDPPEVPGPEGHRKCLRLMQLAETFNKPLILLIDMPAVCPSPASNQELVNEAIAHNLEKMSSLMTPVIGIIMNEHSATTAIEMCAADRVIIFEDVSYSISLTDKTLVSNTDNAIPYLKAQDLLNLNIVHRIVKGAEEDESDFAANLMRQVILEELFQLRQVPLDTLVQERLNRLQYQLLDLNVSKISSGK